MRVVTQWAQPHVSGGGIQDIAVGPDVIYLAGYFEYVRDRWQPGIVAIRRPSGEAKVSDFSRADARWSFSVNATSPVRDRAALRFQLPAAGPVKVRLYDVQGRLVKNLVDRPLNAGPHRIETDVRGLPAGVYWYALEWNGRKESRRVTLLR